MRLPQDPLLSFFIFSASSTGNKDAFHYGKHLSLFEFCVSINNKISCSHLLSSLTVHCSYRLKFFVFKDHLWDGNSLPQLRFSWLRSTRDSRRSKYTEGVERRIATRRSRLSQACEEVPRYSLTLGAHAQAARVTVLGLCVCVSVCVLLNIS